MHPTLPRRRTKSIRVSALSFQTRDQVVQGSSPGRAPPQPLPTDTRLPMTFRPVLPRYGILRWGSRSLQGEQLPGASSFGKALRFLIRDWGSKCDHECAQVAEACSTEALKMPNPAPKANAVCERFLESVRRECPDHLPVVEDRQLHRVIKEYG